MMFKGYYVQDENLNPVRAESAEQFAREFENANRRVVQRTEFTDYGVDISTVFLGIDHNFTGEGAAILYETMVFDRGESADMERYATRPEAQAGHEAMVEKWKQIMAQRQKLLEDPPPAVPPKEEEEDDGDTPDLPDMGGQGGERPVAGIGGGPTVRWDDERAEDPNWRRKFE